MDASLFPVKVIFPFLVTAEILGSHRTVIPLFKSPKDGLTEIKLLDSDKAQEVFEKILKVFSPPAEVKLRILGEALKISSAPLCDTVIVLAVNPNPATGIENDRREVAVLLSHTTLTVPLFNPLSGINLKFGNVSRIFQLVFEAILKDFSPPVAGKRRLKGLNVIVAVAPLCVTGIDIVETPVPAIYKTVFLDKADVFALQVMVRVALFDPIATFEERYAAESEIVHGIFDVMVMVLVPAVDVNDRLVGLTDNLGSSPN